MANNIVSLHAAKTDDQELCVICPCGGVTFMVLSTGELECASCGDRMVDDLTAVAVEDLPGGKAPEATKRAETFNSTAFALRRLAREIAEDETIALIVINKDGRVHVWNDELDGDDEATWMRRQLGFASQLILGADKTPDDKKG